MKPLRTILPWLINAVLLIVLILLLSTLSIGSLPVSLAAPGAVPAIGAIAGGNAELLLFTPEDYRAFLPLISR